MKTIDAKVEEILAPSSEKVRASTLTITGQLRVEIPGRAPYEGVDRVEISHSPAMDVDIKGSITKDGKDVLVTGSVSATGYRSDAALKELYKSEEVRLIKDPHVVIYKGAQIITLNQVQDVPVVRVVNGRLSYQ